MLLDYCALFSRLILKNNKVHRTAFGLLSNKEHRTIKLYELLLIILYFIEV